MTTRRSTGSMVAAAVLATSLSVASLACTRDASAPASTVQPSATTPATTTAPSQATPTAATTTPLARGDVAPAFSLQGSDGKTHSLADDAGKNAVVIAWFPKAFTGG